MEIPGIAEFRVLVVPGWHGSNDQHWQSRWERLHPFFERVEQAHWDQPDLAVWSERLAEALAISSRPALVVAHSFGCLTTIHCARNGAPNLAGALLVAPADPARFGAVELLRNVKLTCPSFMVGSRNDPWMESSSSAEWAALWGSEFIDGGMLGHINADSDLGDWPFGLSLLQQLASRHA
jgi:predicted alpha/beta hydrolase family esterase